MEPRYEPAQFEEKISALWEKIEAFNPDKNKTLNTTSGSRPTFSIVMPPPNANDPLHIGHAMFVTIEDILIRFHRMLGDDTVWLPGTDHAGIETQFVFEKKLQKQGKSRFNFDRQTLYNMIAEYVQENSDVAVAQIKKLGASADWSRFTFTLDQKAVSEALKTFSKLYADGLVYRDLQLVNYCTKCGTSYSELEVVHVERTTPLYYMKYGPFVLATTRPETKFGDTAVAVHPTDKRYKKYIGQTIEVEGLNGIFSLRVIADEYVDPQFGTGVVKITPAHDFNDFAVWQRHKDEMPPLKQVIGFDGKLNQLAGQFAGMKIAAAREAIVNELQKLNLLEKIDTSYTNSVGTCYRCGTVLEPLPLPQFFIKVNDPRKSLTKPVLNTLKTKKTVIHGAGYDKILSHWLTNLKDWNISRQIVWGIRIPVWYDVSNHQESTTVSFIDKKGTFRTGALNEWLTTYSLEEILAGLQQSNVGIAATAFEISQEKPDKPGLWIPETDTFDTWFSSSQWPITTLKANRGTDDSDNATNHDDFERFYPTSVMETAYDILIFWVMRMMIMGTYITGKTPFSDVYLHGLIRDEKGQKMSKSKGNVINPLDIVTEFGADALRLALVIRSTPGIDKSVGRPDFKAARNLTNKLWNATRYILDKELENSESQANTTPEETVKNDTVFKAKLKTRIEATTQQLSDLKIGLAADDLYNDFWHWYCDESIELHKNNKLSSPALLEGLVVFIKLFHPFMPFVTEAIWQNLYAKKIVSEACLATSLWPQ